MTQGKRRQALNETLWRVADIATLLSPDGISVRFLHYNELMPLDRLDNLKTSREIQDRLDKVYWNGPTPLGLKLAQTIVEPMIIDKVKRDELAKPVIVVVITDGEVSQHSPSPTAAWKPQEPTLFGSLLHSQTPSNLFDPIS